MTRDSELRQWERLKEAAFKAAMRCPCLNRRRALLDTASEAATRIHWLQLPLPQDPSVGGHP